MELINRARIGAVSGILAIVALLMPAGAVRSADPEEDAKPRRVIPRARAIPGADDSQIDAEDPRDVEDVAERFEPKEPRDAKEQNRVDALAWFMTGKLKEERNDTQGALDCYRKAVELDPEAIEVYRAIVPLAFSLGKAEEAVTFALKAIQLDPDDYLLLRRLAVFMAGRGQPAEAIRLLEQATQSSTLDHASTAYVALMRDLAVLYRKTGQVGPAADHYAVVFDALKDPEKYHLDFRIRAELLADEDSSYEEIGQAFLDASRPELAIEAFELAAKERRGKPGNLSYNLAQVYLQTGKPDQALTELQKYFDAQLQSKGRDAYALLAEILAALQQSDSLIEKLEAMAEGDPRNTTLQYFLAEQYVAKDRLSDAEALYKKTLDESGDARGFLGLASVYRRQGRAGELLETLAKSIRDGRELESLAEEMQAVSQDRELLDSLLEAGRNRAAGDNPQIDFPESYVLARLAVAAALPEAAIEFYKHAQNTAPDRKRMAPKLYQELSDFLLDNGNYAEAATVLQEAAASPDLAPIKVTFLFRLSQAQALTGNTAGALEAIGEALKLNPDAPLLHFQQAWIQYNAQNWDEAIRLFNQVMEQFPQEEDLVRRCQFSLSNVYVQKGDIATGEQILEKIYAESPDDPSVNNDLGYLYADQGKNLEQAESMIRKAVTAEPDKAAYLDSLGWVLFKLERYEEAVTYLEKASAFPEGDDATIWDHLGDAYQHLNKIDKALEAWQKALERAEGSGHQDANLIERIREKLKNHREPVGALRPENPQSP